MDQPKPHGILNLNKPSGISSSDILGPYRKMGAKRFKVGHAGTLDPFATGVLLVLLGDGTRLQSLAMNLPKIYRMTVCFGITTDTLDPDGTETESVDPGTDAPDGFDEAVDGFRGEIDQVPPAFSALKIDGRRAYDLARRGQTPDMEQKTRAVTIHDIRVDSVDWPTATLTVTCSAGTYMRSLARDLGACFGLPAMLIALERTAIGPWKVSEALDGADVLEARPDIARIREMSLARVEPLSSIVAAAGVPSFDVTLESARRFASGLALSALNGREGAPAAVTVDGDRLVGLGDLSPAGLNPRTILSSSREFLESGT